MLNLVFFRRKYSLFEVLCYLFMRYISSALLCFPIVISFTALICTYVVVFGSELHFLDYFSWFLPEYVNGELTLTKDDVFAAFLKISFVVFIAKSFLLYLLENVLGLDMSFMIKARSEKVTYIVLASIQAIAFVVCSFFQKMPAGYEGTMPSVGGFFSFFLISTIGAIFFYWIYFKVNAFSLYLQDNFGVSD